MYKKRLAGYAALGYTVADVVRNWCFSLRISFGAVWYW
jgi:hypothetical protein